MQNSTMSLPNRSHSVTEMGTLNGDHHNHHHRSGLRHSNSTANNSLLYQRSLSCVKTMNEYNVEPTLNNDHSFRAEKYNLVRYHFSLIFLRMNSFFFRIQILVHTNRQTMVIRFIILIRYLK